MIKNIQSLMDKSKNFAKETLKQITNSYNITVIIALCSGYVQ